MPQPAPQHNNTVKSDREGLKFPIVRFAHFMSDPEFFVMRGLDPRIYSESIRSGGVGWTNNLTMC
jgi:hypothetical protein